MGRSGYQVHDLHKVPLYHVQIGSKRYSGGVDGGVVPYAVRAASAAKLLRIGFEHKQSTQDKATFRNEQSTCGTGERLPLVCGPAPKVVEVA